VYEALMDDRSSACISLTSGWAGRAINRRMDGSQISIQDGLVLYDPSATNCVGVLSRSVNG
jgi:hypothetical protein